MNLETTYLGLKLKNPLIISSSGLTRSLENIIKFEKLGASAIVIKSLFEEQIKQKINSVISLDSENTYSQADDYIRAYTEDHEVGEYLEYISLAKRNINIPVIASINCISATEWTSFTKKIEDAGADAIELNIFVLPSDPDKNAENYEKIYFDIVENVRKHTKLPVAIKLSWYFSGLANMIRKLSWTGINGVVLFNRFYSPDINIHQLDIKPSDIYSTPDEIYNSLRWVAILSDIVECDISASTGIHDGEGAIKQLLAGAKTVQICSTLYKHGFQRISEILSDIEKWMKEKNYNSIDEFRGKMSMRKIQNPAVLNRVQFMKHYAGIE
ncbi:MAG: dihydroorotate dehydrogenase-like protein [Bacteroidetes bacterium]|nr:dihydroorotate dehydrogenase-like protein [Bacteroidota bacterium]